MPPKTAPEALKKPKPTSDLTAFKNKQPSPAPNLAVHASQGAGGKVKPKKNIERETEVVALKLTPTEKQALADRAGLVGLSTYLKHYLRTETDLLKPKAKD